MDEATTPVITDPATPSVASPALAEPTIEQQVAQLETEIAEKKEQLQLIDELFKAMRENAEEEERQVTQDEISKIEADLAAL